MPQQKFSPQDVQDLLNIKSQMPKGDPRAAKIDTLLAPLRGQLPSSLVPSGLQEPVNAMDRLKQWAGNETMGAIKGATSTLYDVGEIATKHLDPQRYAADQERMKANPRAAAQLQGVLTPDPGQKLGFYGEQLAEFAAPDAIIGKAAKAVKGAEFLANAPRLAKAASIATKIAGTSLASGGMSSLHGSDFSTGAEAGAVSAGLGEGIAAAGNNLGSYLMNNTMNISGSKLARTNPGEYLMGNPLWAVTKKGLRDKAATVADQVGNQIDQITSNSNKWVDLTPTRQAGQQFLNRWGAEGLQNELGPRGEAVMDVTRNFVDPVAGNLGRPPMVPIADAMNVKRGLGKIAPWNENPLYGKPVTAMRDTMYGTLNDAVNKAEPALAPLNNAYKNLSVVGNSIEPKASLWQHLHTLGSMGMMGAVGGGVGGYESHSWGGAATGALAGEALYLGARSVPGVYGVGLGSQLAPGAANLAKNAFLAGQYHSSDAQGTNPDPQPSAK